jgi:hypothetical protein
MKLRIVAFVCVPLIAGLALPVISSAPSSASTTVSECSYGQLEIAITSGTGGLAGHIGIPFLIANTGNKSCTVEGYPTLAFYSQGKHVNATVQHATSEIYAEPKPALVTIGPDGVATFAISYTDAYNPGRNTAACHVNAVRVSLPTINPEHEEYGASLNFDICQSNRKVRTTPIELGPTPKHFSG